jgi:hypothetical protein
MRSKQAIKGAFKMIIKILSSTLIMALSSVPNTKLSLVLLSMVLTMMSALSMAGNPGGGRSYEDGLFWGSDLNRNEQLDRNEAKSVYNLADEKIFSRYDKDGNDSISRFEFMDFIQQKPWLSSPKERDDKY